VKKNNSSPLILSFTRRRIAWNLDQWSSLCYFNTKRYIAII